MPETYLREAGWWVANINGIVVLRRQRHGDLGEECNRVCGAHVCLWGEYIRTHCAADRAYLCSDLGQESEFQGFLQSLRQANMESGLHLWTQPEMVAWLNSDDRTTDDLIRPLIKLYERQTSSEQIIGYTVHRNGVGFSFKDSRRVNELLKKLRMLSNPALTALEIMKLKVLLTRYRRQLTNIANQGA